MNARIITTVVTLALLGWLGGAMLTSTHKGEAEAATTCIKLPTATPTPTPTPTPSGSTITLGGTSRNIASHPRFISSARLTTLRNRSVPGKRLWDQLTINNDGYAASCGTFNQVAMYALAVGYLSNPTKTAWRDCAVTHFNKIKDLTTAYNVNDYGSMDLADFAYVYDILYSDLSAANRTAFIDWVIGTWIPYLNTHAYNMTGANCTAEPTHNLCITKLFGDYLFALSCVGEDGRCDTRAVADYNYYHTAGVKTLLDSAYAGCHTFSGSHYGRVRYQPYLLEIANAEDTAVGITASWMSWMDSCPQFYVHSALPEFTATGCPFTGTTCALFDADFYPGANLYDQGRNLRGILLPLERDPTNADHKKAQYWLENVHHVVTTPYADTGRINSSTTYGGKEYLAEWHLRYNQDATAVDYTGWPTTYVATGAGQVYSRDAWGSGDKFWMSSNASTFYGDHQTTGCGDVKIFKNGEFGIVENDTKYSAGNSNQTALASYLRNIIVLGNGQVTYGGPSYLTGGFGVYGQASTCTIPKYSYGATYAYWHENLDSAYRSDIFPVALVRRNFFHFKPIGAATNNYVFILDAVDPTNSITETQQFYVPKDSPTVSDPDVSFTLTNTKTMIRRIYPTGGTISSANVTSGATAGVYQATGMARVTNATTASTALQQLGVVISMQGTGGSLPATTAINGASGALVGVLINDSTYSRIALAPAGSGTVSGTFTFDANPTGTNKEYVIAGLTAGTLYTVARVVNTFTMTAGAGPITVDSMGVARWTE